MNMFESAFLLETLLFLLQYLPVTLSIALASMIGGIGAGLFSALAVRYKIPVFSAVCRAYVLFGRSVPNMVLLYLVYFALPLGLLYIEDRWGIAIPFRSLSAYVIAVTALTLHTGAYLSEVFRSAFESVEKGQLEAATAMGMTWPQSFRHVIVPQALVYAVPLMGNQFLGLLKSTSLVFSITVVELFGAGQVLSAQNYRYTEIYIITAVIYWALSIGCETLFSIIEKRSAFFKRQAHDPVAKHS
jgi:His/Glu/Gln/Arg/opine family amino acid ABC transporter permease subunit